MLPPFTCMTIKEITFNISGDNNESVNMKDGIPCSYTTFSKSEWFKVLEKFVV